MSDSSVSVADFISSAAFLSESCERFPPWSDWALDASESFHVTIEEQTPSTHSALDGGLFEPQPAAVSPRAAATNTSAMSGRRCTKRP